MHMGDGLCALMTVRFDLEIDAALPKNVTAEPNTAGAPAKAKLLSFAISKRTYVSE